MFDDNQKTIKTRRISDESNIDVSIVLVSWNSRKLIEGCLHSIDTSKTTIHFEIVISDNNSTDGTKEWLHQLEMSRQDVRCVFGETNAGFGVGNNHALPYCRGRYIVFLNTDTLLLEPLDALVKVANELGDHCGALGGRVLNADRSLQMTARMEYTLPVILSGFTFAYVGFRPSWVRKQELEGWDHETLRNVSMISGCYILVPKHVLETVGAFHPGIFLFYEDADLCKRINQAGYGIWYAPVSTIVHIEGQGSRTTGLSPLVLGSGFASARYYTETYLGVIAERVLFYTVMLFWVIVLVLVFPVALFVPIARIRQKSWHRVKLLSRVISETARQRTLITNRQETANINQ